MGMEEFRDYEGAQAYSQLRTIYWKFEKHSTGFWAMEQLQVIWSTILSQEGSGADFDPINMNTWTTTTQVCASIVHMYMCLIPIMLEQGHTCT